MKINYTFGMKTVNPFVGGSSPPRGATLIMASRKLFISKPAEMWVFFRLLEKVLETIERSNSNYL